MVWPLTSQPSMTVDTSKDTVEHLIYGHFPGIEGTVMEDGYEGWVALRTMQWGAGLGIGYGGSDDDDEEKAEPQEDVYSDRNTSDPSVSEVVVSRPSGPESGKFLYYIMAKKTIEVTLVSLIRRTPATSPANPTPAPTLTRTMAYTLHHTLFSGHLRSVGEIGRSSDLYMTETLCLNFGGIESISYDAEGNAIDSVHYHLQTGTSTCKVWNKVLDVFDVMEVKKKAKKVNKDKNEKKEDVAEVSEEITEDVATGAS